jgi:type IV secretion system protein VirD4
LAISWQRCLCLACGTERKLVNIANVAAGSGIEALFITQDKGQIESVHGRGDAAGPLDSCVTIRIFGLGRAETVTAQWAADALGDRTILSESRQHGKFGEPPRQTTTEQRQKLLIADQIIEMPTNKMLLLTGSKRPLVIDRIISHSHAAYRKKLDRNPVLQILCRFRVV